MRVHHLNCGTLRPRGGRLVNGGAAVWGRAHLVCHCLLIETEAGLVLVDSGFGTQDVAGRGAAHHRLFMRLGMSAALRPEETALAQVRARGHDPADVRHVVLTHLDYDHAGGLADFPRAQVHVLADEHAAAMRPRSLLERTRYQPELWAHGPDWVLHRPTGEPWRGFAAARDLPGVPPELLLIPLAGHTRGHCGVAVETEAGWLLHAGDAYFHAGDVAQPRRCPSLLRAFQRAVAVENAQRLANLERLRELATGSADEVRVFSAHDPSELEAARSAAPEPRASPQ